MESAYKNNTALKTFLVTALVSVVLFGVFYYLVTDLSQTESLDEPKASATENLQASNQGSEIAPAVEPEKTLNEEVLGAETQKTQESAQKVSVFGQISSKKPDVQAKTVLAGADGMDETSQSSVPATGSDFMFMAFVFSSLIMFTGVYMLITGPRQKALAKFERRVIKELD